ncbi:DUF5677 domain-containing protein [Achromobacter xylosoxidans]|uniref:DUF5677 domain-containing protein n=1 Tax=Alcaligenes xylosoxydans xylosoxydans TaxID=85698 RepID=UPI00122F69E4|nr:DUF5677 domain-containing protein [Achromobacter xylosoxidans]MCZ8384357.1 DUF5677 domain-containing protein [Achromobacter xylosoxidans]QEQ25602.1 hypothetical protein F0U64_26250 [Achromobacter xylosoxidans]
MSQSSSVKTDIPASAWPEWRYFDEVNALLGKIISAAKDAKSSRVGALYPLLDSIEESVSSLRTLARMQALRDSYVISRVIYETSINACFLLTSPVELTNRANVHAKQKALRSLVRRIEIAGSPLFEFKAIGTDEILQDPKHKELLAEFTSKSGREITSWTSENVQQRLEAIYQTFGSEASKGLAFGLLLYRHASEIAHGTLYGTLFSWGAMDLGRSLKSPEDLAIFRRAELRHVLKLISFTLESLVHVCAQALALQPLAALATKARLDYYESR